jgi:hypothetical protein
MSPVTSRNSRLVTKELANTCSRHLNAWVTSFLVATSGRHSGQDNDLSSYWAQRDMGAKYYLRYESGRAVFSPIYVPDFLDTEWNILVPHAVFTVETLDT